MWRKILGIEEAIEDNNDAFCYSDGQLMYRAREKLRGKYTGNQYYLLEEDDCPYFAWKKQQPVCTYQKETT